MPAEMTTDRKKEAFADPQILVYDWGYRVEAIEAIDGCQGVAGFVARMFYVDSFGVHFTTPRNLWRERRGVNSLFSMNNRIEATSRLAIAGGFYRLLENGLIPEHLKQEVEEVLAAIPESRRSNLPPGEDGERKLIGIVNKETDLALRILEFHGAKITPKTREDWKGLIDEQVWTVNPIERDGRTCWTIEPAIT